MNSGVPSKMNKVVSWSEALHETLLVCYRQGGFYFERWGDAPVHSLAAAMLLNSSEVCCPLSLPTQRYACIASAGW